MTARLPLDRSVKSGRFRASSGGISDARGREQDEGVVVYTQLIGSPEDPLPEEENEEDTKALVEYIATEIERVQGLSQKSDGKTEPKTDGVDTAIGYPTFPKAARVLH